MKKTFLTLAILGVISLTQAQITITNSTMPTAGMSRLMSRDTTPDQSIVPGTAGTNMTWDFTKVKKGKDGGEQFMIPSLTPYGNSFPTASLCNFNGIYAYYISNNDSVYAIGIAGDITGKGIITTAKFGDYQKVMEFPATYNKKFSDRMTLDMKMYFGQTGVDTVRRKALENNVYTIDGWGTVKLPSGNYPALRVSQVKNTVDSTFIYGMNPNNLGKVEWYFQQASTNQEYDISYWGQINQNLILPVVEYSVDKDNKFTGSIDFFVSLSTGINENNYSNNLTVYPNPAKDVLNITAEKNSEVKVYNVSGQLVKQFTSASLSSQVNISDLKVGIYTIEVSNDREVKHSKFIKE